MSLSSRMSGFLRIAPRLRRDAGDFQGAGRPRASSARPAASSASRNPSAAQASAPTTCASVWPKREQPARRAAAGAATRPRTPRRSSSRRASRSPAAAAAARSASARTRPATTPTSRPPTQLTSSVPSGKPGQRAFSQTPAPQRSSAPTTAPPATAAISARARQRSAGASPVVAALPAGDAPARQRRVVGDARIDPARALGRRLPSSRTAPASSGSPSGTRRPGRPAPRCAEVTATSTIWSLRLQHADAMDRRARRGCRSGACASSIIASIASRSCRGSARAPCDCTPAPSLRSRTVPTKAATAPTPASPARSAATSAPRSKSSVWIVTRGAAMRVSAAGDRREEADLGASRERRGSRRTATWFDARSARALAARQRLGMAAAARDQRVAQRGRRRRRRGSSTSSPGAERLAQRGEVAHLRPSSQQLRERQEAHRVARRDRLPGRVVDQAVGPDRRGQHARALVGEQVEAAVRRCGARAGTRGAGRAAASRSRRASAIGRGASVASRPAAAAAPAAPRAGR